MSLTLFLSYMDYIFVLSAPDFVMRFIYNILGF